MMLFSGIVRRSLHLVETGCAPCWSEQDCEDYFRLIQAVVNQGVVNPDDGRPGEGLIAIDEFEQCCFQIHEDLCL